jgi:hypothetical protein
MALSFGAILTRSVIAAAQDHARESDERMIGSSPR